MMRRLGRFLPHRRWGRGTMRSMVEGAGAALGIRPLHRLRRSPSPASRVRNQHNVLTHCGTL